MRLKREEVREEVQTVPGSKNLKRWERQRSGGKPPTGKGQKKEEMLAEQPGIEKRKIISFARECKFILWGTHYWEKGQ